MLGEISFIDLLFLELRCCALGGGLIEAVFQGDSCSSAFSLLFCILYLWCFS